MVRVLVDSSADFSKEELAAKKLDMVPLTITINESEHYKDELELSRAMLYSRMAEGNCTFKTAQPSPQDFAECFEAAKAAGDELVCIMLSSSLSGTYQSAMLAKNMIEYDKIYVVDALTATVAIRILADYALQLIDENYSGAEIAEKIEALKSKVKIKAAVDTLKFLYLGGRVSKTTAVVADAVNVKPGIFVTVDGYVGVGSKYLGVARAVKDLTKQMKNENINTDFPVYTLYSHDPANMQKLQKSLTDAGIAVSGAHEIGATIGVHTGPGVFGVVYVQA